MAARVLGILNEAPETFFAELSDSAESIDSGDVERLIEERSEARANKDWKEADAIRDRLKEMGVVLEDGPDGTTWRFDV
jgi:cysteinyl-tRNA synthetase